MLSAVPPVTQVSEPTTSLTIAYPKYQYVMKDTGFNLHFHVYNNTQLIVEDDASCYLHLYSPTQGHTAEQQALIDGNNVDYEVNILAGNFSTVGEHAFILYCNSTSQAGFASGIFIVTQSGEFYEERHETIVYVFIFMAAVCLFLGNWFKEEHWMLRSFFAFIALGFSLLSINSVLQLVGGTTRLFVMATTGITLIYVLIAVYFIYIFVYMFIESIKMFRNKEGITWSNDVDKD